MASRERHRTGDECAPAKWTVGRIYVDSGGLGNWQGCFHPDRYESPGNGFAGVFTQHSDIGRTGQNVNETALTLANVNSTSFGKLFAQTVDGQLYAQPLYVPNVTIAGQTHNVIYVATEADSVYAFDADSNTGANANPLWRASLIDTAHGAAAGATPVDAVNGINCNALVPLVGVTSTPVIDPSTNTMYVVAKSAESKGYVQRLHAIDITTGAEKSQGSAVIAGSVSGTGDGSSNGTLAFNPQMHLNRPGLLLLNGVVYVGFASNCDTPPFHGWVFAYDAATSSLRAVYVSTPNGSDGGIWNSGAGLSGDSNANLYIATGNGTFDTAQIPATNLGDSIVKLFLNGSIARLPPITSLHTTRAHTTPETWTLDQAAFYCFPISPAATRINWCWLRRGDGCTKSIEIR